MNAAPLNTRQQAADALLIEGYASRFGVADRVGDVVRAGAFAAALRQRSVPMLLQHKTVAQAGYWARMIEDGRGLFVRGLVDRTASHRTCCWGNGFPFYRGHLKCAADGFRNPIGDE